MSQSSQNKSLSQLRKEAAARGVLKESAWPRRAPSNAEIRVIGKNVYRVALPKPTGRRLRGVIRPVLHPRPRQSYGDLYAPLYEPSTRDGVYSSVNKKRNPRLKVDRKSCKACSESTGKKCTHLAPSSKGHALANKVVVARSTKPQPTRKRIPNPIYPLRSSPGSSPLRQSFTADEFEEANRNDIDVEISSNENDGYTISSVPFPSSNEELLPLLKLEMFMRKDEMVDYLGKSEMLWLNSSSLDLSCVSSKSDHNEVVTRIEGPFRPGSDTPDNSGCDKKLVGVDTSSSLDGRDDGSEGSRPQPQVVESGASAEHAPNHTKTVLTQSYSVLRGTDKRPSTTSCKRHPRVGRGVAAGWHCLRSIGVSFKGKFPLRKLKEFKVV